MLSILRISPFDIGVNVINDEQNELLRLKYSKSVRLETLSTQFLTTEKKHN